MNDDTFEPLFQRVMGKVMEIYQPGCVVLQSGADSLSNDKLGHFNLSTKGHASCLKFMKRFGVPIILLGGGGYNVSNVARCWAYETGVSLGIELDTNTTVPKDDSFY